jgi:hypothetical protein
LSICQKSFWGKVLSHVRMAFSPENKSPTVNFNCNSKFCIKWSKMIKKIKVEKSQAWAAIHHTTYKALYLQSFVFAKLRICKASYLQSFVFAKLRICKALYLQSFVFAKLHIYQASYLQSFLS